tara:strand:+ start:3808 stop:4527 length:720 start_codon:yes stop_codon:yes gene_type:complete
MESLGDILKGIQVRRQEAGSMVADEPTELVCPKCKGAGWVSTRFYTEGRKTHEGIRPCACNAPKAISGPTFETFKTNVKYPTLMEAILATQEWCAGNGPPLLILGGSRGVGKTHLARAARRQIALEGATTRWMKDGDLIDTIHRAFEDHTVDVWMNELRTVPWLFLDDIGLSPLSDTMRGFYDRIIDARWEGAAEGRRTMFTTNLLPKDFPLRMASRLSDKRLSEAMVIDAPDYRQISV